MVKINSVYPKNIRNGGEDRTDGTYRNRNNVIQKIYID